MRSAARLASACLEAVTLVILMDSSIQISLGLGTVRIHAPAVSPGERS